MTTDKVLLLGRKPPPIGGVTMHVMRLEAALRRTAFEPVCLDMRTLGVAGTLRAIAAHRLCHLHLSNAYVRLLLVLWARLVSTPVVITVHGDLRGARGLRRLANRCAIGCCDRPVILNEGSLALARAWNAAAVRISSYLPADADEALPEPLAQRILRFREQWRPHGPLIITSAFDHVVDATGKELYGVMDLIRWCGQRSLGLVVCDPSGRYAAVVNERLGGVPPQVLLLSEPLSFVAAARLCDVYVRNTTTDGDALSIHEALSLGKSVWATSVVDRPLGTLLFDDLAQIDPGRRSAEQWAEPQTLPQLLECYRSLVAPRRHSA